MGATGGWRHDARLPAASARDKSTKGRHLSAWLLRRIRALDPGRFAMAMATGSVSIAAFSSGLVPLAWGLFQLNKVAYAALWAVTAVRLIVFRPGVVEDLTHPLRGAGFLTVPAATCVLGSQFLLLAGDAATGRGLWLLGIALWTLLIYAFLAVMTTEGAKPPLERALSGGWLIVVVATQSVSVLGTLVASRGAAWQHVGLFFALAMYLLGGMLYAPLIGLILHRLLFVRLTPEALTPSYWVNMGPWPFPHLPVPC